MAQRLPPELENKLVRYQVLQNQLARIMQERAAVESEIAEIDRVVRFLEEQGQDTTVYRAVGNILVKVDRDKLLSELKDRKEILELRLQKLRRQEEELKRQLDQVASEIRKYQQVPSPGKGGG